MRAFGAMAAFKKLIILWLMVALPAGCQRKAPEYRVIVADGNQVKIPWRQK